MPFNVTMPDGTVIEDVPDGTTKAQIAAKYQALRGTAGAAPEPVATVDVPAGEGARQPLKVDVNALPENLRTPDAMATLRGFGDTMLLNYADELGSAIESGQTSGPEYDRLMAENAALRATDDPNARSAGELIGMLGGLLVPAGAAGRVAGLSKQALTGAATGGTMAAIAGSGANGPDNRTATLGSDFAIGSTIGLAAPAVAATARKVVQGLPLLPRKLAGMIDQTTADDAILASGLTQEGLMSRLQEFQKANPGKAPRVSDIMTPEEAQRFTKPLSRSPESRRRVLETFSEDAQALPQNLAKEITSGPGITTVGPAQATAVRRATDKSLYGAAENNVYSLAGPNRIVLAEDILPYVSLPKATAAKIQERFDNDALTGGDLVTIRRALDRFNKQTTNSGTAYADLVTELDSIIGEVAPELNRARNVSAANRALTEGTQLGRSAAVPGNRSGEIVTEVRNARDLEQPGIAPGARSALVDQAIGNPRQAYDLAKNLEGNRGFQDQLRAALPPEEANSLIAFATSQKKAIDNLAAMARIPDEKVGSILDNVEEMTDVIVAAGVGAGGAFKASLVNQGLARLGVGKGAANKLADDLLNPAKRERVIRLLEQRGLPRQGVRELVQGAFISTANTLATADRPPVSDQPQ